MGVRFPVEVRCLSVFKIYLGNCRRGVVTIRQLNIISTGARLAAWYCLWSVLTFNTAVVAQENPNTPPLLTLSDGLVTGFSGVRFPETNNEVSTEDSDASRIFIDPDGASLRGFALGQSNTIGPFGQPVAPEFFAVRASDIGQVFGIALDDATDPGGGATAPNIYVTATSVYGLAIVHTTSEGVEERLFTGTAQARWMHGLFGTANGGGPGSVWKIDGMSGEVSLFADITVDDQPIGGAALGSIAFDPTNRQFFVSDRDTGRIHRLDLIGNKIDTFDHGVAGRTAGGLDPVEDDGHRGEITNPAFDATDPTTWGYTSPSRRIWGLAVYQNRLYYAVADGPQIWSVGLHDDGSFDEATVRLEIALAAVAGNLEVATIIFDRGGQMIIAQRPAISVDKQFANFISLGNSRVLRFRRDDTDDPANPGVWQLTPDEYAVGLTGSSRNANGGVAMGYGYNADGEVDFESCDATVWATGDWLRADPTKAKLEDDGTEATMAAGLQGTPAALVRPDNVPPVGAMVIDYDGQYPPVLQSGHVGAVTIHTSCPGSEPPGASADATPQPDTPTAPPGQAPPAGAEDADLAVAKTQLGPCPAGQDCAFEIAITNLGPADYYGPLFVTDTAPAGLAVNASAPWFCQQAGAAITCSHPAHLIKVGQSLMLPLTIKSPTGPAIASWDNCAAITWLGGNKSQTVIAVQIELAGLGYYQGAIDGLAGKGTSKAIKELKAAIGLPVTGKITPALLDWLFGPGAAAAGDPNPTNDQACVTVAGNVLTAIPMDLLGQLQVKKTASGTCTFGALCPFQITITNPTAVPIKTTMNAIDAMWRSHDGAPLSNPIPSGDAPGFCSGEAPAGVVKTPLKCTAEIDLAPGESKTYTIGIKIDDPKMDPANANNFDPDPNVSFIAAQNCITFTVIGPPAPIVMDCTSVPFAVGQVAGQPPGTPPGQQGAQPPGLQPMQTVPLPGTLPAGTAPTPPNVPAPGLQPMQTVPLPGTLPAGTAPGTAQPGQPPAGAPAPGQPPAGTPPPAGTQPGATQPGQPPQTSNPPGLTGSGIKLVPVIPVIPMAPGAAKPKPTTKNQGDPSTPDISVEKIGPVGGTCVPGKLCSFKIIVRGTSDKPFTTPFEIVDTLPVGWSFGGSAEAALWSCKKTQDATRCTFKVHNSGGFTKADSVSTTMLLRTQTATSLGLVANCAKLKFPPNTVEFPDKYVDCAFVYAGEKSKLVVEKKPIGNGICRVGAECSFRVTIRNTGKGAYNGFTDIRDIVTGIPGFRLTKAQGKGWVCYVHDVAASCQKFLKLKPGTSDTLIITGFLDTWASSAAMRNCAVANIYSPQPGDIPADVKKQLMTNFLMSKGYKSASLGPAEFSKAVIHYKSSIGMGANPDDEVTDNFFQFTMLPAASDEAAYYDDQGIGRIGGCGEARIQPALKLWKTGVTDYFSATGVDCRDNHHCRYTITISNPSDVPYFGPITIRDEPHDGWKVTKFEIKAAGTWQCHGSGPAECTHPPVTITKGKPLSLTVYIEPTQAFTNTTTTSGIVHPLIENCAYLKFHGQVMKQAPYAGCAYVRIMALDTSFGWNADGTRSCAPPNCSFFEFTATLDKGRYAGPIDIQITLPKGSRFKRAQITKSTTSCPATSFICGQVGSGANISCRSSSCTLAPGEQIAVRIDANLVPDMTEPPERELKLQTCGVLGWQKSSGSSGIEQTVGIETRQACVITHILAAKPKPVTCPRADGWKPYPEGSAVLPGWMLKKFGSGANAIFCMKLQSTDLQISSLPKGRCVVGSICGVVTRVKNVGKSAHNKPIEVQGAFTPPVSIRQIVPPAGWRCRMSGGGRYRCDTANGGLAIGAALNITMAMSVPRGFTGRRISHSVRLAWPQGAGDVNPANDVALFSIPIVAEQPIKPAQPAKPTPPPQTSRVLCVGGKVVNGVCQCRRGSYRVREGSQRYRCDQTKTVAPKRTIECIDGKRIGDRCQCRRGWTRKRINRWRYRCIPPVAPKRQIECIAGRVDNNRCICPSGWARKRHNRWRYQCLPPLAPTPAPTRQIECVAGQVINNQCICRRGWRRIRHNRWRYQCTPPPAPAPTPAPVRPLVTKPPKLIPVPIPPCPPGQYWNRDARRCVKPLQ